MQSPSYLIPPPQVVPKYIAIRQQDDRGIPESFHRVFPENDGGWLSVQGFSLCRRRRQLEKNSVATPEMPSNRGGSVEIASLVEDDAGLRVDAIARDWNRKLYRVVSVCPDAQAPPISATNQNPGCGGRCPRSRPHQS